MKVDQIRAALDATFESVSELRALRESLKQEGNVAVAREQSLHEDRIGRNATRYVHGEFKAARMPEMRQAERAIKAEENTPDVPELISMSENK